MRGGILRSARHRSVSVATQLSGSNDGEFFAARLSEESACNLLAAFYIYAAFVAGRWSAHPGNHGIAG